MEHLLNNSKHTRDSRIWKSLMKMQKKKEIEEE